MSEDVCRLCSKNNVALINIFEDNFDDKELSKKVYICFGIKITKNDPIPKKICKQCYYLINSYSELRLSAINNNTRLWTEYESKQKIYELAKVRQSVPNITQDTFLSSLKLTSVNTQSNKYVINTRDRCIRYHPSVNHLKLQNPCLNIPLMCQQWNMAPTVELDRSIVENWAMMSKLDVWAVNRRKNQKPGLVFTRVHNKRSVSSDGTNASCTQSFIDNESDEPNSSKSKNSVLEPRLCLTRLNENIVSQKISMISKNSNSSKTRNKKNGQASNRKKIESETPSKRRKQDFEKMSPSRNKGKLKVLATLIKKDQNLNNSTMHIDDISEIEESSLLMRAGHECKTFICQTCNLVYDTMKHLKDHQRQHLKTSLRCYKCSKSFPMVEDLIKHNLDMHTTDSITDNQVELNMQNKMDFENSMPDEIIDSDKIPAGVPELKKMVARKSTNRISMKIEENIQVTDEQIMEPGTSHVTARKSTCQVKDNQISQVNSLPVLSAVKSAWQVKEGEILGLTMPSLVSKKSTCQVKNVIDQPKSDAKEMVEQMVAETSTCQVKMPEPNKANETESSGNDVEHQILNTASQILKDSIANEKAFVDISSSDDSDIYVVPNKVEEYIISSDEDVEVVSCTNSSSVETADVPKLDQSVKSKKRNAKSKSSNSISNKDNEIAKDGSKSSESDNLCILKTALQSKNISENSCEAVQFITERGVLHMPDLDNVIEGHRIAKFRKQKSSFTYTSKKNLQVAGSSKDIVTRSITDEDLFLNYIFNKSYNKKEKVKKIEDKKSGKNSWILKDMDKLLEKSFIPIEFVPVTETNTVLKYVFSGSKQPKLKNAHYRWSILNAIDVPKNNTHKIVPLYQGNDKNSALAQSGQIYSIPKTMEIVSVTSASSITTNTQHSVFGKPLITKYSTVYTPFVMAEQRTARIMGQDPNMVLGEIPSNSVVPQKVSLYGDMSQRTLNTGANILPLQNILQPQREEFIAKVLPNGVLKLIPAIKSKEAIPFKLQTIAPKPSSAIELKSPQNATVKPVSDGKCIKPVSNATVRPVSGTTIPTFKPNNDASFIVGQQANFSIQNFVSFQLPSKPGDPCTSSSGVNTNANNCIPSSTSSNAPNSSTSENSNVNLKPVLRIKNLSELKEQMNETNIKVNQPFTLHDLYVQTLTKYVNSCSNSPVDGKSNLDEYLQIS